MTNSKTHSDLPDLTWVIPGELAAMGRPGSIVGFAREMKALLAVGIRRIISLTERPLGVGMGPLTDFQIYHLPVVDFRAPSQEIIERSVELIDEARAAGEGILVHCYMGIGRTGTVVAAYLTTQGLTGIEAIDRVRELRPGSVEVPAQEEAVVTYWANRQ